ncbi:hypothetical protein V8G54_017128 [Vigna mungo]|uniref:Serine-threonine/tyrosine-protein kinase catalytic domain-containing protein n=1 Tax=Vigna mungo TaxID=3915 RepID=A0AAQ3NP78_VIGMU
MATTLGLELLPAGGPKRFTYSEIKAATNDFSNLIGKGGFGDVYKGELPDHRVVAVKCLKNVTGGDAEFWAEVTIIARMHHLNLSMNTSPVAHWTSTSSGSTSLTVIITTILKINQVQTHHSRSRFWIGA